MANGIQYNYMSNDMYGESKSHFMYKSIVSELTSNKIL